MFENAVHAPPRPGQRADDYCVTRAEPSRRGRRAIGDSVLKLLPSDFFIPRFITRIILGSEISSITNIFLCEYRSFCIPLLFYFYLFFHRPGIVYLASEDFLFSTSKTFARSERPGYQKKNIEQPSHRVHSRTRYTRSRPDSSEYLFSFL